MMDTHTRRNLELTQPMNGRAKRGHYSGCLTVRARPWADECLPAFLNGRYGQRAEIEKIRRVEELVGSYGIRTSLVEALLNVYDVERIATKVAYGSVNPRDCLSLAQSLHALPGVKVCFPEPKAPC